MCGPGGCMFGPWGWGMMIFMMLFWVALVAGLIILIVWAVRQFGGTGRIRENPLDILDARYARGEISREEYERTKREISERKA